MKPEEVVIDEPFLAEEQEIEPFGWEDLLYEAWLEEHLQKQKRKPAEGGA